MHLGYFHDDLGPISARRLLELPQPRAYRIRLLRLSLLAPRAYLADELAALAHLSTPAKQAVDTRCDDRKRE